jgi:NADPH2:quinone reductase
VKAVRIHAWNQAPLVEELPNPVPRPGRTIVKMAAATVAHIDRTVAQGKFMTPLRPPYVPGVEGAGTVVSSERFAPGQRVWLRGAGLGTRSDGTWCELADAPDAAIGELPDGVDMAQASAFFSPCASAWVALHDVGGLQPGERVGITGASGAVGTAATQLAREHGARLVETPGPDHPVDLLIDAVGGPVLQDLLAAVEPGGRAVLVGYTAGEAVTFSLPWLLQRDVRLLPLNMVRRDAQGRAAVPELLRRLADGRLSVATQRFALADIAQALHWITRRGHRGRAVLDFS